MLVLLSGFLTSAANLLFRTAMNGTAHLRSSQIVRLLLHTPVFYLGWVTYGVAALTWFRVLKTEPLSSGYPILMGLTFVVVTFGAVFLFDEALSLTKATGIVVILLGIILVSRS
jgi:multidrug transporter EmrE-like cation transporter